MGHLSGNVDFECKLSRVSWYISLWNIAILISVDEWLVWNLNPPKSDLLEVNHIDSFDVLTVSNQDCSNWRIFNFSPKSMVWRKGKRDHVDGCHRCVTLFFRTVYWNLSTQIGLLRFWMQMDYACCTLFHSLIQTFLTREWSMLPRLKAVLQAKVTSCNRNKRTLISDKRVGFAFATSAFISSEIFVLASQARLPPTTMLLW